MANLEGRKHACAASMMKTRSAVAAGGAACRGNRVPAQQAQKSETTKFNREIAQPQRPSGRSLGRKLHAGELHAMSVIVLRHDLKSTHHEVHAEASSWCAK